MNLVSGDFYWTAINKVSEKYDYLSENITTDVVIIGGGITGAICGYYFSDSGIDTVLVDKNIIGYGSTRASTSILQYEIDTNLSGLIDMIGEDNAVRAFKLCKDAVYEIQDITKKLDNDCGFVLKDCFYYTDKVLHKRIVKKEYELRKKNGFDVELIDEYKATQMFSFPVKAGIYSTKLAGEIDPYRFSHNLLKKSIEKGMRVYENTEIIDLKSEETGIILTTRNGFKIRAKKALLAVGFETDKYIDKKVYNLSRSFTIVTEPINEIKGIYNKCIVRDTNKVYNYIRCTNDNRIIIGGEDIGVRTHKSKLKGLPNDNPIAIEKYANLEKTLKNFFPQLESVKIEYKFNGLFGDTGDGLPYIGQYEGMPNRYFCLACGSNGILYAITGAQMLRDLHLGKQYSDMDIFRFNR